LPYWEGDPVTSKVSYRCTVPLPVYMENIKILLSMDFLLDSNVVKKNYPKKNYNLENYR
jgi:hypothetical protein